MNRRAVPTIVSQVESILKEHSDEFITAHEILRLLPGTQYNGISAALHHLRKYRAADVVIQSGTGHWFATPESDQRVCTRPLREPEGKPRRPRRGRKAGAGTRAKLREEGA